jgi:hypothetical protein
VLQKRGPAADRSGGTITAYSAAIASGPAGQVISLNKVEFVGY